MHPAQNRANRTSGYIGKAYQYFLFPQNLVENGTAKRIKHVQVTGTGVIFPNASFCHRGRRLYHLLGNVGGQALVRNVWIPSSCILSCIKRFRIRDMHRVTHLISQAICQHVRTPGFLGDSILSVPPVSWAISKTFRGVAEGLCPFQHQVRNLKANVLPTLIILSCLFHAGYIEVLSGLLSRFAGCSTTRHSQEGWLRQR